MEVIHKSMRNIGKVRAMDRCCPWLKKYVKIFIPYLTRADLYLVHQPYGDYYGSWKAMVELYREGKIRALGVSNFFDDRLVDFAVSNDVIPAVCQRETHPYNQQWVSQEWMKKYNV